MGWKSLNSRYGAAAHISKAVLAGSGAQMPMHLAQQHAHHGLAQVVAPGQQVPEAVRQRQYPLSHWDIRDDVVHQVRGAFGHAPPAAASTPTHPVRASGTPARTEPSALARERDQTLGTARTAPEPGEPASEPGPPPRGLCVVGWEETARHEGLELVLDKARHALAVAPVRRLGEKRLQVLAHHTMQYVRRGITRGVVDRRQSHRVGGGRIACRWLPRVSVRRFPALADSPWRPRRTANATGVAVPAHTA